MGRRTKSSIAIRVSRPIQKQSVGRTIHVYRQKNGRIGSSTMRNVTGEVEEDSKPAEASSSNAGPSHPYTMDDVSAIQTFGDQGELMDEYNMDDWEGAGDDDDTEDNDKAEKTPSTRPTTEWLPYREQYLDELLRHDGRGGEQPMKCHKCGGSAAYKCRDCAYNKHSCLDCLLSGHGDAPLHRILEWTGSFFNDTSLKKLGLVIQLGHGGGICPSPSALQTDFVIVDIMGIHQINLKFCECHAVAGASHSRVQLLRMGWFPSTVTRPNTAFTFNVLDSFHLLTLQAKTSAYDFYYSIAHKTDNTGILPLKSRYHQFLVVMRLWRHLKLLKRAGRGHDPAGVAATAPGQCAVDCLACPNPDWNLPANWAMLPEEQRWLHALRLTEDANFRLKNKAHGISNDEPLGDGWGHWVPEKPYMEYINEYGYQTEPNLCESELHAVDHANIKFSEGYVATGVGGVLCARHGLVRKNGLGSLQKGERYANMDFILLSTLLGCILLPLILSYDIICQWARNFGKRLQQFPEAMRLPLDQFKTITYVIPKFHIYAHGSACQTKFSLNFLPGMAHTDGEEPERWWAHINPISMSTKEMGPGARVDTIDDHAAAWNWRKNTNFGTSLSTALETSITMRDEHQAFFRQTSATFAPEIVVEWEEMVRQWNADHRKLDPYAEPDECTSMSTLRLELAKEEAADAEKGELPPHKTSPSAFLQLGLDLEDQQSTLASLAKEKYTTNREIQLVEKQNVLRRRILSFFEIQRIYMPAHGRDPESTALRHPETIPLQLPSSIPSSQTATCLYGIGQIEHRLRLAQAQDALSDLRRQLRITKGLRQYKYTQVGPSQRAGTRTYTLINRFREKTSHCVERYRRARSALLVLDPGGQWQSELLPLSDDDVRAPGKGDGESEGTRHLSWIWRVQRRGEDASDEEIQSCLRVEWAKSKARADRWTENVSLVTEEMRCVIQSLDQKARWWEDQANAHMTDQADLADGKNAYAMKQAYIRHSMAKKFALKWYPLLIKNSIPVTWVSGYIPLADQLKKN